LPEGAELHLFSQGGKYRIRPFTAADNKPHGQLWTPVLQGESMVLELQVPAAARDRVELEIGSINYGYRGFFEPATPRSGACNVDVVCPEGDAWQTQINSVAVISTGGGTFCTGFMVNNVENDGTPYFMTADHCGIGAGNAPSLVTYWNYQNSTCRTPGSGASGGPGDGTLDQFNTGSTFRAARSASDFVLVELDALPDPAWGVAYAGWDARDLATTTGAIAVHHPSTDEKRISFENDPTTISSYGGNTGSGTTHIRVADWDLGTTEGGSSGSPLFSPEGRVIGQLHGGLAACGNDDPDWYGRMAVSWNTGTTPSSRLRDWLDPNDTGTLVIDALGDDGFGIEPAETEVSQCGFADIDIPITIAQFGSFAEPVTLSITGEPAGMTTGFSTNPVAPPGTTTLSLSTLAAAGAGNYEITIQGVSNSQSRQAQITLDLAEGTPGAAGLSAPADGAVDVNTRPTLEWAAVATASSYGVEIATDAAFTNVIYSNTETGTEHTVETALNPSTEYFVRVRAVNDCDAGAWSATISFTTANLICSAPALAIPDGDATGTTTDIVVGEGGALQTMELQLDITHSYVGDLIVRLEHVESSTVIDIMNRVLGDNASFGCDADNVRTTASDDAPLSFENDCNRGDSNEAYPEPAYSPDQPMSTFAGVPLAGTWRLFVSDNAGFDTGTVNEWCLLPTGQSPLIFDDRFEDETP
jgi:subtilisin-like proprotein convertase family protein